MSNSPVDELLALKREAANEIVDVDEPGVKLVVFALGERYFAFRGKFIQEILPGSETLFYVPGMPASIQGVINVRGDIASVILLQELLQLQASRDNQQGPILLGHASGMHTGIRVDELLDVMDLPMSSLKPVPDSLPESLKPYVAALLDFKGKAVALLDIEKVFQDYQEGLG
ncbi:purine-binding chemotaxis protein CheW [Marinospirillum celere]|uniref:Purine-binding chemotaxis protein CheW n=1 Tax=Marinospirillum celere TaxID=1122252 RepID=A0A1I1EL89_9GAMM|nr:chemotaxis protein CheW [Marinospirillum celere]SFB87841.1 purine-binding chemotaxis protein CheW [Marinospirillum celere]